MTEYGDKKKWVVDHIIPQEAFDFSNSDDVKRCWSAPNIQALGPKENDEKSYHIIDELCRKVGAAYFPLSWNGQIPTDAEKEIFYTKCKTPWVPPPSQPVSSSATYQSDDSSDSD
jgi:hypothetical protein